MQKSFRNKDQLRHVFARREESVLGKRASFWNFDPNGLANDFLKEIVHYTKNFGPDEESLQFGATAEFLRSNARLMQKSSDAKS